MRDMSESPPHRFEFDQLRFIIAAILLIAAGLKAHQLATVPLPPVVQNSIFTPLLEFLNERNFQIAVVIGEILFALILIAGLAKSWMWLFSLIGFSAFTLISLMKAIGGEGSCGCFGVVTVNPWFTATFDAVIVGLLLVFREKVDWSFPPLDKKKVLAVLVVWLTLTAPATYWMLSLKQQPHETLGTEFIGADGRITIMLEPDMWIGKRFPLWDRVDDESRSILETGEWNIVISRKQCDECKRLIERLGITVPLALLEIDDGLMDFAPPSDHQSMVSVTGSLEIDPNWILLTPFVIQCLDGVCVSIGEDLCREEE